MELGIGSRVKHATYGDGVVVNVKPSAYIITFMQAGRKEIAREHNQLEIIEAIEAPDDMISSADVERSLISILRRWSDIQE